MKKILFVTYDFPYPTTSGGKTRSYNLLKFAGKNLEIHLFSFVRSDFNDENKKAVEEIGVKEISIFNRRPLLSPKNIVTFFSPKNSIFNYLYFDKKIEKLLLKYLLKNKIDIVHFESFYTGYYLSQAIKDIGVKQIFGTENIEYVIYKDYLKQKTPKLLYPFLKREVEKIKKEEDEMYKKSDLIIAVTKNDKEIINKTCLTKCEIVENGVDLNSFSFNIPEKKDRTRLLFVGNFSYFPNSDAIHFFYNEVFKNLPREFTLDIIGRGVKKLGISDKRVRIQEFVQDIRSAYSSSDILISPIRIGGGTNFKILEAMASGLPVVATPERIGDLQAIPGKDLLVGNNALELKKHLIMLKDSYSLSLSLSKSARTFIEKNYSWDIIGEKLNNVWKNL